MAVRVLRRRPAAKRHRSSSRSSRSRSSRDGSDDRYGAQRHAHYTDRRGSRQRRAYSRASSNHSSGSGSRVSSRRRSRRRSTQARHRDRSWQTSYSDSDAHCSADSFAGSRSGSYTSDADSAYSRSRSTSARSAHAACSKDGDDDKNSNNSSSDDKDDRHSSHSSHSSSSSSSMSASSEEERNLRYPRFDAEYAARFRHELVPFLQPITTAATSPKRVHAPHVAAVCCTHTERDGHGGDGCRGTPHDDSARCSPSTTGCGVTATAAPLALHTLSSSSMASWPIAQLRDMATWVPMGSPAGVNHHHHYHHNSNISETSNSSAACCIDTRGGGHSSRRRSSSSSSNSNSNSSSGNNKKKNNDSNTHNLDNHHSNKDSHRRRRRRGGSSSDDAAGLPCSQPIARELLHPRRGCAATASTDMAATATAANNNNDNSDNDHNSSNKAPNKLSSNNNSSRAADVATATPVRRVPPLPAPSSVSQWLLYGSYVLCGVLGKGTYSKVVLARRLQRGDAAVPRAALATSSLVALKIFRDKTAYREACWDEVVVLRVLSQQVIAHADDGDQGTTPSPCARAYGTVLAAHATAAARIDNTPRVESSHNKARRDMNLATVSHAGQLHTATSNSNNNSSNSNHNNGGGGDGGDCAAVTLEHVAHSGCFLGMLDYIPHPVHPAIVLPVMGPSLLRCLRAVRKASRAATAATVAATRAAHATTAGEEEEGREGGEGGGGGEGEGARTRARRWWRRGLPPSLVKAVLYQILLFLQYSHRRGIVHTDMKPENVLFESNITLPTNVRVYCCDQPLRSDSSGCDARAHTTRSSAVDVPARADASSRLPHKYDATAAPTASTSPLTWQHAHTVRVSLPLLNSVRVSDFGTAQLVHRFTHVSHVDNVTRVSYDAIQTSHYRSPEVLLDVGWSASADIFSLGCMIPELVTGECMFMPRDTLEHLALMEHIIGPFAPATCAASTTPTNRSSHEACGGGVVVDNGRVDQRPHVLQEVYSHNATTLQHYFCPRTGRLRWPYTRAERDAQARELACTRDGAHGHTARQRTQSTSTRRQGSHRSSSARSTKGGEAAAAPPPLHITSARDVRFVRQKPTLDELLHDDPLLLDLTRRMLDYHPMRRISADDALQHAYFHTNARTAVE